MRPIVLVVVCCLAGGAGIHNHLSPKWYSYVVDFNPLGESLEVSHLGIGTNSQSNMRTISVLDLGVVWNEWKWT